MGNVINIKEFKMEERQIREVINTPIGIVEIYEPSLEDATKIIDLQKVSNGVAKFDGFAVIKHLFPMLTNMSFEGVSDEELEEIINNPKLHLLMAQQVVTQIVMEVNKLYAHRAKTELMNAETHLASLELLNSIPTFIVENAKKDGKVEELMANVEKMTDEIAKELESELEKEASHLQVVEDEKEDGDID